MHTTQQAVVREVLARIDRAPGTLPWRDVPGATTAFRSQGDLLRALQMRWHAHLAARVDAELEADGPSVHAVARAYRDSVATRSALRTTLDRHQDDPALRAAEESELALLAAAAGLVEPGTSQRHAVTLGRRLRAEITADLPVAGHEQPQPRGRGPVCHATRWIRALRRRTPRAA